MTSHPSARWFAGLLALVLLTASSASATQVGVWQFNDNLTNAIAGKSALAAGGGWSPTFMTDTIGGSAATVLSFPALDNTQGLDMPNDAAPNGSGGLPTKNNWSIVMDVKFPALDGFTGLWETDAVGSGDGDYFINGAGGGGGMGIASQYGGFIAADTWTRLAMTVDSTTTAGTFTINGYIDGVLSASATTGAAPGGREAVKSFLHLFGDDDLETSPGLVNSVAYYGEVLSDVTIGTLGGATAAGVPSAANQAGLWNFTNNLNNSIGGKAAMAAIGGWSPAYMSDTIAGSPATVLAFPAFDATQALDMPNQATPDDFGAVTSTNIWSIVMDVKFPVLSGFTALWNTDAVGDLDGEYFIRDDSGSGTSGGIGISGQYNGVVNADTWTRIAVTVDGSAAGGAYVVTGYIDGVLAGVSNTSTAPNGREAITDILHLFTDDDFETAAGLINSLAFYDEVLTAEAIAALGGASASGITVAPQTDADFDDDGDVDGADFLRWQRGVGINSGAHERAGRRRRQRGGERRGSGGVEGGLRRGGAAARQGLCRSRRRPRWRCWRLVRSLPSAAAGSRDRVTNVTWLRSSRRGGRSIGGRRPDPRRRRRLRPPRWSAAGFP